MREYRRVVRRFAGPLAGAALALLAATAPGRAQDTTEAEAPERLDLKGIENAYRLSPRLYSGGEPRGEDALRALKELGVRTIVSVDGARPDVETARRLGMRYVHLPVGYDGVPREQGLRIVEAARSLPGPVFVHCHHGKHRGPAAAALCGIAAEGWDEARAIAWLKAAGTSPDYRGLFASVRAFRPPTEEERSHVAPDAWPEVAEVPALVDAMVRIDGRWDRLKAAQAAGFRAPAGQPDLDPPHEALQLAEQFRELLRLDETKAKGDDFRRAMEAAERRAVLLEEALRSLAGSSAPEARAKADDAFRAAGKSCTACHARHRDG